MSPAALERWRVVLEARRDWLAKRGIKYLLVVAPDKETIYAEDVPPWFTRAPGPSRLEQLREMLERTRAVDFLDLTDAVAAQKASERVYHLTDTHWNDAGAFAGYRAITARLAAWFPAVAPLDPTASSVSRSSRGAAIWRASAACRPIFLEPQVQGHLRPGLAAATLRRRRAHHLRARRRSPALRPRDAERGRRDRLRDRRA